MTISNDAEKVLDKILTPFMIKNKMFSILENEGTSW